jgi:hypothetical protein
MVREITAQRKRKTEKQGKHPPPKKGKPQRHTSQEVGKNRTAMANPQQKTTKKSRKNGFQVNEAEK